jgi:hypothetical protein
VIAAIIGLAAACVFLYLFFPSGYQTKVEERRDIKNHGVAAVEIIQVNREERRPGFHHMNFPTVLSFTMWVDSFDGEGS